MIKKCIQFEAKEIALKRAGIMGACKARSHESQQ